MKDLKHLSYFENLLQDSGNELVDKARQRSAGQCGKLCESDTHRQHHKAPCSLSQCKHYC